MLTILEHQDKGAGNEIQLTDAMAKSIGIVPFHGYRFKGRRFDCGSRLGYLEANIAYGLERDDMRSSVQELLKKFVQGD